MMAKFSFDIRGNLAPSGLMPATIATIEEELVRPFCNASRSNLFNEYRRYTNDLKMLLKHPFYQWMNGSFVRNTLDPADIDLVSFIDDVIYGVHEETIRKQFGKWSASSFYKNIDAYVVRTYPTEHKHFAIFQADEAYWYDWFSKTRRDRHRNRHSKGFISIDVE